jgi:hypothetical protein
MKQNEKNLKDHCEKEQKALTVKVRAFAFEELYLFFKYL